MEGMPALPSLPTTQPPPATLPGGFGPPAAPGAQSPRVTNPVGRPSSDPAQQEQRIARSQEQQRLQNLTPQRAKDSKLYCFKMVHGRPERQPAAKLLASQIASSLYYFERCEHGFISLQCKCITSPVRVP